MEKFLLATDLQDLGTSCELLRHKVMPQPYRQRADAWHNTTVCPQHRANRKLTALTICQIKSFENPLNHSQTL